MKDLDQLAKLPDGQAAHRPDVRAVRAQALAELGRLDEAREIAAAVVEEAPHNGVVLLRAARVAKRAGSPSDELVRRALLARRPRLTSRQRQEAGDLAA